MNRTIEDMEVITRNFRTSLIVILSLAAFPFVSGTARGQSFGVELLNNVMPASGAMAGASIAKPQDLQSSIYGNPATLTQFRGTQFSFGSAWIEPTYNITQTANLPGFGVSAFPQTKSDAQGVAGGNIGVTQDFNAMGFPVTTGLGLMAGAGAAGDFRQVPASNGTHVSIVALDIVNSVGVDLTDRLALGTSFVLSSATLDGPFVGITGASSDYGIRGGIGFNYELPVDTSVGLYWKSEVGYTFENLIKFGSGPFLDVSVDRPEILGLGISNNSLMDGKLLLSIDGVFQNYSDTDFFRAIYVDQWAVQCGAQYSPNCRCRLRAGYAYNENPMRDIVPASAGGILPPGGVAHIQYIQAQLALIPQHRITGGVGVRDVLPGVDVDLYAGGMFKETQQFSTTIASLEGYWVGFGLTWRFCRGA
jgi:long-chain fatty acid transport protein